MKPLPADSRATVPTRDEHSYAEPDVVAVTHLALDLTLDFGQKTLSGTATLDLDWRNPAAATLVLDSRQLRIDTVEAGDGATWATVQFEVAPPDPVLGSKLIVTLGRQAPKYGSAIGPCPRLPVCNG